MSDLFTKTMVTGNTRNNLVESMFSNTASPIGGIKKELVYLNMDASKYPPHYKGSHVK